MGSGPPTRGMACALDAMRQGLCEYAGGHEIFFRAGRRAQTDMTVSEAGILPAQGVNQNPVNRHYYIAQPSFSDIDVLSDPPIYHYSTAKHADKRSARSHHGASG